MPGTRAIAQKKPAARQRDRILRELSEKLREHFGPHITQIILFGSRARGDFDKDSDYDVLALVDEKTRELDAGMFDLACDISFRHNVCVSLFVEAQSLFDSREYEPLFINARREGVPL